MLSKRILVLMFLLLFLPLVGCLPGLTPSTPDGISTGTITGVINGSPGVPLAGANVSIEGTELSTNTNSSGAYTLSDVLPGLRYLIVTYQGEQIKKKVTVTAGITITLNISFSQEQQAEEEEIKSAISGRIMTPNPKNAKDITGWVPLANATVTLTDSEGVTHTVTTDEDGYYTFTDVAVNANAIITATGTVNGNTVIVKDVIPQAVAADGYYDAGTADAESTALALIVEELLEQGLDPKDIDLGKIQDSDNFTAVVGQVSSTLDKNGNVTTDPGVTGAVGNVAGEINPPVPPPITLTIRWLEDAIRYNADGSFYSSWPNDPNGPATLIQDNGGYYFADVNEVYNVHGDLIPFSGTAVISETGALSVHTTYYLTVNANLYPELPIENDIEGQVEIIIYGEPVDGIDGTWVGTYTQLKYAYGTSEAVLAQYPEAIKCPGSEIKWFVQYTDYIAHEWE